MEKQRWSLKDRWIVIVREMEGERKSTGKKIQETSIDQQIGIVVVTNEAVPKYGFNCMIFYPYSQQSGVEAIKLIVKPYLTQQNVGLQPTEGSNQA